MTSDHWRRVEGLYANVAELRSEDARTLLDSLRAREPEVVAEVESLLAARPQSDRFLSTPWVSGEAGPSGLGQALEGRTIGAFRLVETIGTGGMGVVYRAEREEAGFAQRAAIKIVTATRWHAASLEQFKAERQLLASLQHPHIVALLDGGVTADGLAYLVMEFVDGVPITRYCREHALTTRERLALFRQVCAAVQYAHRHSIVHRDLKPANILITADGVPKILDFGIARLLVNPSEGTTPAATGWLQALTPNYASPEQLRGLPASMTDDVYALGVLLFELLTGQLPCETTGTPLDDVLRLVVEHPAPRPSTAVDRATSNTRRADLAGDLDAIVLKAVDKDPMRRYGSAQELADDLGRHLAGHLVVAREPSFVYVLTTMARRHRALVAASMISAVAIFAALGVSVVQTRRALAERDRADERFGEVRRLANTLIFDIHDAVQPLPGSTPVRERIVKEALGYLERLARDTSDDDLRLELGMAYHRIGNVQGNPTGPNLGDREAAVDSYGKAIALLLPAADRSRSAATEMASTRFALVSTLNALGRLEEARAVARQAQATAEHLVAGSAGDGEARRMLGTAYFWQATLAPTGTGEGQSIPLWIKASQVFESLLTEQPENPGRQRNVALAAKYLGEQYRQVGDLDRALEQHQRAREIDEARMARAPGNRQAQMDLALDWASLGGLYREMGLLREAAASLQQSLTVRQALAASDPKDDYLRGRLAHAHALLGAVYIDLGRRPDALDHLREAVGLGESRSQGDAQGRLELIRNLVTLADLEGGSDACRHLTRAAQLRVTDAGGDSPAGQDGRELADTIATRLTACGTSPADPHGR